MPSSCSVRRWLWRKPIGIPPISWDSTDLTGYIIGRTQNPYIWAVLSGGEAGAQATMTVSGTKELR